MSGRLRIGTRGSALALAQSEAVLRRLAIECPGLELQIEVLTVSGDRAETPPDMDKRKWVDGIERALLEGTIDIAVHSAKDVPAELAPGLRLLGSPARGPAEDVLCGARSVQALPGDARVGTSSARRAAQLRAARPDLQPVPIAGNVDTRLRKLEQDGGWEAIVLAQAGLQRLGLEDRVGAVLDPRSFVPAPGQGTIVLEGRSEDADASAAAEAIGDPQTFACLLAERALASELHADCHTPLGAHAAPAGCGCLQLRAWVGLPDGSHWARDELLGGFFDPEELGRRMAERLAGVGALEILRQAGEMAAVER